ncbi:hypothetical protein [Streptomyces smyrnaeus]|uniref:hypothetical protein n=1 Tax=Streptomyces smyrnaeus TaxID=1387713 RepID=UPI0033C5982B
MALTSVLLMGNASADVSGWDFDNMTPTDGYPFACRQGMEGGTLCKTDGPDVYYYMDSKDDFKLEAGDKDIVRKMLRNEYSPTDLAIHYESSPTFSGDNETDTIWQEGSSGLPSSAIGMTWCDDDSGPFFSCDQHYIRIRGNGVYDGSVTCHEMGHAVGLTHGSDAWPKINDEDPLLACMIRQGWNDNLGSSNTKQINDGY